MDEQAALVLFSGGQDSATCLVWALERFDRVETIGFDYGQRHRVELEAREWFRERLAALLPDWASRLGEDHLLDLTTLGQISDTALTQSQAFAAGRDGLPNTFVPGRNLIFLTYAGAVAWRRDIHVLIAGMCETDYSGYPDCRNDTLQTLARAITMGMAYDIRLETPLMWIDKAGTWAMAHAIGGDALVDEIIENTHTCYAGDRNTRHDWGYGCGSCPACKLRSNGWQQWQKTRKD
ncbi:MAG: 7-cyano-7-deazaguanine synthase QueC [Alphaproteobacteria bacterium]|nr:7-cyano-7-deazaguanine synthase QueC [Alphaproteobacteria bacterium]